MNIQHTQMQGCIQTLKTGSKTNTAGPQMTSFFYNVDEMPEELNSCVYQLTCGKNCFRL